MTFSIVVEGNIGSGKSTFIERLSKEMSEMVKVLKEPVNEWQDVGGFNLLDLFYKDGSKYAVAFQTFVGLTMVRRSNSPMDKPVIIGERSIESGIHCFVPLQLEMGVIDHAQEAVLLEVLKHFVTGLTKPDLVIYLRCDPQISFQRLQGRSRAEEVSVPFKYLQRLHQLHELWLVPGKVSSPLLVVDNDSDIANDDRSFYRETASKILASMGSQ